MEGDPIEAKQRDRGFRHAYCISRPLSLNLASLRLRTNAVTDAFHPRSDFLATLQQRGFIHQCSDFAGLDEKALSGSLVAYIGFDCTAPSLHVGSLMQIMLLHWLQKTGGKPIALMGGGTTMVGDPSGKDESRKLLTVEQIDANKAGIRKAFSKFISFGEGKTEAAMPDNAEWLTKLNYIEFLRDVGSHLSINRMLAMDSVKMRLEREQALSFLEFNYMCLQAYDFVELHRRYACTLQMGGSDQWGNIVTGVDLGRRLGTAQLYALTSPLITTASGAKMGKTAAGAVWLDASLLSPYDYWQFWRNTEDGDVGRFLRLFTLLPLDEIGRLDALAGAEINEAKKVLANEATGLLHGAEAARLAAETARRTFEEGALAESLPTVDVPRNEFDGSIGALNAFMRAGLVASNGEARRLIQSRGLSVNGVVVDSDQRKIGVQDIQNGVVKLSLGRKKHVLLRPK
jgi:tyrosyl-tRNA synthetase